MKKFLYHFFSCIVLYMQGFYLTPNTHLEKDGNFWGFIRLNLEAKNCVGHYAIYDIAIDNTVNGIVGGRLDTIHVKGGELWYARGKFVKEN